ncbi:F-box/kelch-repeat protein At3g23880-like [Quercus suber]|uniref:F-box/kelch-repeat protein At3g23880-like n=1 Tax=Quercus suber TaxID=58331 RepID=UPI000CE1A79D|nr:F-box/kelch-repeat protein At3g23880-like [Quercus suber]
MSDYLPEEVVLQILYKIPVKSLIRFRCVSKSWNSLITSSAFIHSHLTPSLSLPSNSDKLIVKDYDYRNEVVTYKFIHDENNDYSLHQHVEFPLRDGGYTYLQLIGSVNGLFCLFESEQIILWNPYIRKFITLPKPLPKTYRPIAWTYSYRYGFGFDPRNNDYKVVRMSERSKAKPPLVEVYSLKEGSWRRKTSAATLLKPGIAFEGQSAMAALNGAVHFRHCQSKLREKLEFDIFGFRGSLSVVCYEPPHRSCSIWVMKKYGVVKTWSKLFTVDLCGVIKRVIGFRKNGHIFVAAKLGLGDELNLSSYDPESQQLKNKKLGISGWPSSFCADNYVKNLILLDKPVLFDKANGALSQWVVSRKRKSR